MNRDISSILNEILEIIDYTTDKELFIQQFQEANFLEAILNVYEQLPQNTQQKIKEYETNPEILRQYIPVDLYKAELHKVTEAALNDFISSISEKLVPAQKKRIAEIITPL